MLIRVPLPHCGIELERSASRSEEAQESISLWHQEIREAALLHVTGGLQPIPRAHLVLELCYGPPKPDGLYRPQSLGEAHRLVTHAIRALIQADVLLCNSAMSATRESVTRATVRWCGHRGHVDEPFEAGIWITVEE